MTTAVTRPQPNEADLVSKLHLQRDFGELHATYRWFSWKRLLIYLPGTILFLFFGSIIIWLGITLLSKAREFLLLTIMGWGMLVAGLWGIYRITAVLINRTMIEIASDRLSVHPGPLPYPGNHSVQCSELKEIRLEKTSKSGIPLFLPIEGAGLDLTLKGSFYQLRAVLKDGRKFGLVYGSDGHTICYLKAAITQHLGLKDSSPTSESTVPIIEMQNPDGTSTLVAAPLEIDLVPFQCPWCGQTYQTAESGDNVFFDCPNCKNRTYITRS